mmetsp:Transcript_9326/g.14101  ORF Transcript_9326/g.14101 Transcript_9326/m.14101 type:complete len:482 (-) Transcript_9326:6-1451(-)
MACEKITKLNIFDFDKTLCYSFSPSHDLWNASFITRLKTTRKRKGFGWFEDLLSLNSVGDKANSSSSSSSCSSSLRNSQQLEWNEKIIQLVKDSCDDQFAQTILLTGRSQRFSDLIVKLLADQGLTMDDMILKPIDSKDRTFEFKKDAVISKVKPLLSTLQTINYYDDHYSNLMKVCQHVEQFIAEQNDCALKIYPHWVRGKDTFLDSIEELTIVSQLIENSGFHIEIFDETKHASSFERIKKHLIRPPLPSSKPLRLAYRHEKTVLALDEDSIQALRQHPEIVGLLPEGFTWLGEHFTVSRGSFKNAQNTMKAILAGKDPNSQPLDEPQRSLAIAMCKEGALFKVTIVAVQNIGHLIFGQPCAPFDRFVKPMTIAQFDEGRIKKRIGKIDEKQWQQLDKPLVVQCQLIEQRKIFLVGNQKPNKAPLLKKINYHLLFSAHHIEKKQYGKLIGAIQRSKILDQCETLDQMNNAIELWLQKMK